VFVDRRQGERKKRNGREEGGTKTHRWWSPNEPELGALLRFHSVIIEISEFDVIVRQGQDAVAAVLVLPACGCGCGCGYGYSCGYGDRRLVVYGCTGWLLLLLLFGLFLVSLWLPRGGVGGCCDGLHCWLCHG